MKFNLKNISYDFIITDVCIEDNYFDLESKIINYKNDIDFSTLTKEKINKIFIKPNTLIKNVFLKKYTICNNIVYFSFNFEFIDYEFNIIKERINKLKYLKYRF